MKLSLSFSKSRHPADKLVLPIETATYPLDIRHLIKMSMHLMRLRLKEQFGAFFVVTSGLFVI
jgi:hypothetical protein